MTPEVNTVGAESAAGASAPARFSRRLFATAIAACLRTTAQEKTVQVTERDLRTAASQKVEPEYPAVARQIRLTGDVDLEVSVSPQGMVEKVTVVKGNTLLAGPSVQAVKRWKFNPFNVDGQPARAVGPIRFTFQM